MNRSKWLALGAVIIIAASVGWYFGSPAYSLKRMQAAAKSNDSHAFASYIDFEALREDMKAELMAQMMAEAQKDKSGYGSLGLAFGSALIGPMVDGMVSPAGVRAAFIANRNRPAGQLGKPGLGALAMKSDPVIERRGFSEFIVVSKSKPEQGGMVFKRHGLGWKLSGVDLPQAKEASNTSEGQREK